MIQLGVYPINAFKLDVKEIEAVARAGYDCTEFSMVCLREMSEEQFKDFKKLMKDYDLKLAAIDNPYPTCSVLDESFDLDAFQDELKLGCARAAELGAPYVVYAQRASRVLATEYTPLQIGQRAKAVESMARVAECAADVGMNMLIEICGRNATNFCNTFAEAVGLIDEINIPGVSSMCDLRHMLNSGEPYENMVRYKDYIKLIHIDMPFTNFPVRYFPSLNDGFNYDPFFNALKRMGYDGAINVEARTYNDFEADMREGLKFFEHYGMKPAKSN